MLCVRQLRHVLPAISASPLFGPAPSYAALGGFSSFFFKALNHVSLTTALVFFRRRGNGYGCGKNK